MNRKKRLVLGLSALAVMVSAGFGFGFTERDGETAAKNDVQLASAAGLTEEKACASAETYGELKKALFEDALKVRSSDPDNLDTLARHSVVRMEKPVVKSRDEDLGATFCSGTFILELPPGAERYFDGQRRLVADVNYSARPAADGSGLVYQVDGAETIMAKLADFNMLGQGYAPPQQREVQFAEATAQPQAQALGMGGPEEPVPPQEARRAAAIDQAVAAAKAERTRATAREAETASEARKARAERAREQLQARAERSERAKKAERTQRAERKREPKRAQRTELARRTEARPARASARPSFNCRYAKTRSEKMVCSSGALAAHDRRMSAMFYSALSDADPRTRRELQRTRDRFLAYRDRCRSEDCVADTYQGRMREIADIMAATE